MLGQQPTHPSSNQPINLKHNNAKQSKAMNSQPIKSRNVLDQPMPTAEHN